MDEDGLYACLDLASEALGAYTSGLVPDFDGMTEEAYIEWADAVTLGLLEISANLIRWIARLTEQEPAKVRSDFARVIAARQIILGSEDE